MCAAGAFELAGPGGRFKDKVAGRIKENRMAMIDYSSDGERARLGRGWTRPRAQHFACERTSDLGTSWRVSVFREGAEDGARGGRAPNLRGACGMKPSLFKLVALLWAWAFASCAPRESNGPPPFTHDVWRRNAVLLALLLVLGFHRSSQAMFMFEETKLVPVDRLFANLEHRRAQHTNDARLTYQIARLHAMAYSTNLSQIEATAKDEDPDFDSLSAAAGVPRSVHLPVSPQARAQAQQHLTNAIVLFERALVLLKHSTNQSDQRWLVLPMQVGYAWCLDQAGRRADALTAYRKALKAAWRLEVTGDFDFGEWVKDLWNDVSSGRNPLHSRRPSLGAGVCYSEEIIGYLLALLDPVADAREIARLKADQKTLGSMGRAITPILVPLVTGSSLEDLVAPGARVTFDLDGSGRPRRWGWTTSHAAWLVYDADGTGQINSGLQLFGAVSFWVFWRDGYDALAALDDDGDGVLRGAELRHLALWHDANGNGQCDPGEVRPLAAWGVTALDCVGRPHEGCAAWSPTGVTFSDGTTRPTYDWIAPSE